MNAVHRGVAYRIVLQLDRAGDRDDFDDPVEVTTDKVRFELTGPDADERGGALMAEVRAAIDAVLARHGVERPS